MSRRLWRADRIGIAIGEHEVRASCSNGRVAQASLSAERPMAVTLAELIQQLRAKRFPSPRLVATIGPGRAQVRLLSRLPPLADPRTLDALVQSNAGRYFRQNGIPLMTSATRPAGKGEAWCAAIETPVIAALHEVCRAQHLRLELVVPAIVVAAEQARGDVASIRDGELIARARMSRDGTVTGIELDLDTSGTATGVLALADFLAARTNAPPAQLVITGAALSGSRRLAVPPRRSLLAIGVLAVALMGSALAPWWSAYARTSVARGALATLDRESHALDVIDAELATLMHPAADIRTFRQSRRSTVGILGALTRGLPSTISIASIRIDENGGSIVALAPSAATLLDAMSRIEVIETPTVVGGIRVDGSGIARAIRAEVRWTWPAKMVATR